MTKKSQYAANIHANSYNYLMVNMFNFKCDYNDISFLFCPCHSLSTCIFHTEPKPQYIDSAVFGQVLEFSVAICHFLVFLTLNVCLKLLDVM